MLLKDKNAIIYGGGGSIGGAIARAFAREGARVFLAGRTLSTLEKVAEQIRTSGGSAECTVLDALEEKTVNEHATAVVTEAGSLDISVNVISDDDLQGIPLVDLSVDDYLRPIKTAVASKFITACAAARHMSKQESGVILAFGGPVDRGDSLRDYHFGGMQVAFDAVESMRRQMAIEFARYGIRIITLQTGGIPESIPSEFEGGKELADFFNSQSLFGRAASLDDVGNVAVFAASDWARTLTGTTLNMTGGSSLD